MSSALSSSLFFNIEGRWWQFYTLELKGVTTPIVIQTSSFKDPKEILFLTFKHDSIAKTFYLTKTTRRSIVPDYRKDGEEWFVENEATLRLSTKEEVLTWAKNKRVDVSSLDFEQTVESDGKHFLRAMKLTPGAFLETTRFWNDLHEMLKVNKISQETLSSAIAYIGNLYKANSITAQQMAILFSEIFFEFDGETTLFDNITAKPGI